MNKENQAKDSPKNPFALREEAIIEFWEKGRIFEKSVERTAPQGDYVFYDGPPFGTGEPHYGHILSSIAKDVVPRYFTMKGFRVERRWGWDCHGLPIENIIEADLGISGKKEIEKMGVADFNEACRARVLDYAEVWEEMIRRIARWVEFKDSYKTMDPGYMESVWWGFKEMWNKGLVSEGRWVLLYCPRCETPISNFEVAMDNSYRDITEPSLYVKFKIVSNKENVISKKENTYIIAWTTTPWTLPGNVALAVGPAIEYVLVKADEEHLILAKERLTETMDGREYEIVRPVRAEELVGLEYEPLFDVPALRGSDGPVYRVAQADFVTTEDGSGVVHTAVVYGEEDFALGQKLGLPVIPSLDEKGIFNATVPQFQGVYFKKADRMIIADLEKRGLLWRVAEHLHSYPHCHRCNTQLFYNAIPAWFVSIEKLRPRLLELNGQIDWFPPHLKEGRFRLGIEQAPNWNISRNRYFATPIPIWRCGQCGRTEAIGSAAELEDHLDGFWAIRHGVATSNVVDVLSTRPHDGYHLTEEGRAGVRRSVEGLKGEGIELIIASDLDRAKETAAIASEVLGVPVVYDERLRETLVGDWEGMPVKQVRTFIDRRENGSDVPFPHGDNWTRQGDRVLDFYRDFFRNYLYRRILVVSHGDMLTALEAKLRGGDYLANIKDLQLNDNIKNAEIRRFRHKVFDLHNHFVDQVEWPCPECGGAVRRIPEVLDCWVESGSMPFAQMHYPFENKERFQRNFPAHYISEYISQTRAWFYVMHVISTALFDAPGFRNVVATGVILNEKGEKMSKSKKNYPDPWKVINEFGVDALRLYLMGSSLMHAENLFFNERDLRDVFRKNIMLLWNVYKFWETYRPADLAAALEVESKHPLDRWIMVRLKELAAEATRQLDGYDLPRAVRPMTAFIDDLSTWYLRRSRDRFKSAVPEEQLEAAATTAVVLLEFSKLLAPFAPFLAEEIWQQVGGHEFEDGDRSVHLEAWPEHLLAEAADTAIIAEMALVRRLAEIGQAARDQAGIKVRQALAKATVRNARLSDELATILKEELNVKAVEFLPGAGEPAVELDTVITPELKREGQLRELVRSVNELRKKAGLTINDRVDLIIETADPGLLALVGDLPPFVSASTVSAKIRVNPETIAAIIEQASIEIDGAKAVISIAPLG